MSYVKKLKETTSESMSEETAFYRLIGYNILTARQKKGWLQAQLADLAGLSQSALSRMETGAMKPSLYELIQIARVLECNWRGLVP